MIIDAAGYLTERFDAEYKNNNWQFNCPFCDDEKQKFGVSLQKGVVHCFKCNYTKKFISFVADYENMSIAQAFALIQKHAVESTNLHQNLAPCNQHRQVLRIKGYQTLAEIQNAPTWLYKKAINYLIYKRHMTLEDIEYWNLGLSTDDRYIGRIIIPFFERGKLVYFVARAFIGRSGGKYMNPPKDEFNIGKSEILFNIDNAQKFKTIALCEGVFDAFALGYHAVAIMGKSISEMQVHKIAEMKCKNVHIMLDAQTTDAAYEIAYKLAGFKNVKIFELKKGDPAEAKSPWEEATKSSFSLKKLLSRTMRRK